MDKTQILESLRERAENFNVEKLQLSDAMWAEIGKLHRDLIQIDPHYSWVALVTSESGSPQTRYVPVTRCEKAIIQEGFTRRVDLFYELVDKMEIEGLT